MTAPFTPSPRQNVVISGQLADPVFASAFKAFFDGMASPVRFGPPAPRRAYDWKVSKEENLRRAFAEINRAFSK